MPNRALKTQTSIFEGTQIADKYPQNLKIKICGYAKSRFAPSKPENPKLRVRKLPISTLNTQKSKFEGTQIADKYPQYPKIKI